MDTKAYISSGILEQYCLGVLSDDEMVSVEILADQFPEIKNEIERIDDAMKSYAFANPVQPNDKVKVRILLAAYQTAAGAGKKYPPLVLDNSVTDEFRQWLSRVAIPPQDERFDNLSFYDLP